MKIHVNMKRMLYILITYALCIFFYAFGNRNAIISDREHMDTIRENHRVVTMYQSLRGQHEALQEAYDHLFSQYQYLMYLLYNDPDYDFELFDQIWGTAK